MKKFYKLVLAAVLLCTATFQVTAQAVVPPTDGTYFYIKFTRGFNLVLENEGSGTFEAGVMVDGSNQLKTAGFVIGKEAQLWRAVVNGDGYTFISKALDVDGTTELAISWDPVATRFIAAPYDVSTTPALSTTTIGITTKPAYLPAAILLLSPTQVMNPWGGSDIGRTLAVTSDLTDDGNALRFMSTKGLLFDAITTLTAASLKSGFRPAQIQADFQTAIDNANAVYNNVNSTDADYSAATIALNAALVAYDAFLAPPTDGSFFYIKFTRGTNLVLENKGSGTFDAGVMVAGSNQLKSADLVFGKEAQLWRADSDGAGGYFFVSKAKDADAITELQISWDATAGRFIVAPYDGSSTPLYTATRGITTNALYLPASVLLLSPTANQGMNPFGGSDVGSTMAIWDIKDDGDALRFIQEDSTKNLLQSYLAQANAIIEGANLNPGNHSAEVLAAFKAVTASVKAVYANAASTTTDYVSAGNNLRNGVIAYNAAPYTILPEVSTASNEKWYFFQGTRPSNTYMTSMGAGAGVLSKTVIPDNTQLWKIVMNDNPAGTNDGYALVNKVTGEYLNTDTPANNGLNTISTMPALNIVFNISTIMTNGVARFWIENTGTTSASTDGFTFRLHAGETKVLNWFGNRNDNSSFLLMDYSISLKTFLKDAIATANLIVHDATIPVGTALGQYPANAQTNLATAVSTAQAMYDNASATDADVKTAIADLNAAVIICKGRRSDAVISNAANPRWFVIRNLFRKDVNGALNHVITTNGVVENGGLICEVQANANEQLWRFESNATGGVKIINAAMPELGIQESGNNVQQNLVAVANASGYIIDILGAGYKLTSIVSNSVPLHETGAGLLFTYPDGAGTATNWAIEERTLPLFLTQSFTFDAIPDKLTTDAPFELAATSNASVTITYTSSNAAVAYIEGSLVTIVGAGNTVITASNAGDATYATATAQQILTVNLSNGVQDVTDGIRVVVKNRVIVVTGTDAPVKAFTVAGSEVDAKRPLALGIYIVKIAGKTVKINVQ